MKLMAYQSKRGGRCVFQDIAKPVSREMQTIQVKFHLKITTFELIFHHFLAFKVSMEWGTCLEAMEAALELEKMVNQSLLELTKAADDKGDSNLSDFVDEFLEEQVEDKINWSIFDDMINECFRWPQSKALETPSQS